MSGMDFYPDIELRRQAAEMFKLAHRTVSERPHHVELFHEAMRAELDRADYLRSCNRISEALIRLARFWAIWHGQIEQAQPVFQARYLGWEFRWWNGRCHYFRPEDGGHRDAVMTWSATGYRDEPPAALAILEFPNDLRKDN